VFGTEYCGKLSAMKRVLLSLATSFGLVVLYLMISEIVLLTLSPDFDHLNISLARKLGYPLGLPNYAYYHFFPPTAEDFTQHISARRGLIALMLFIVNLLIYATPVYLISLLISRYRRPKSLLPSSDIPPPPPIL